MRNGILLTNVLAVWACTPPDAVLPAGCRDSPAICGPHTVCDVARDVCVLDAPVELGDGGDLQPRGDMGQGPTEIPLGFGACDDSGWCWRNPVPLGGPIGRILALDANNIWVAAGSNSVVKWDGAQWRYQKANIEISVADLWGYDPRNVWAVGGLYASISRWDGMTWTPQTVPSSSGLLGVFGTGMNSVWAVGSDGTILRWNGSAWSPYASGTTHKLSQIWGSSDSDVWATGDVTLHFDGTKWSDTGTRAGNAIWGPDAAHTYRADEYGLSIWTGTTWKLQGWDLPGTFGWKFLGLWGSDISNIWAVGERGLVMKLDSDTWRMQKSNTIEMLGSIAGTSPANIYAAGGDTLLHFDGKAWAPLGPIAAREDLNAIWGADANHIFMVGDHGAIYFFDGTSLATQASGTNENLNAVWGTDAKNVWAVGDKGVVLHFEGAQWTPHPTGSTRMLRRVWGSAANDVWAVGEKGLLIQWDGTTWRQQSVGGLSWEFYSVFGLGKNDVWVGTEHGQARHWDGSAWSSVYISAFGDIHGIWGTAADHMWAVGDAGQAYSWDGTAWTTHDIGGKTQIGSLNDVLGTDDKNLWVIGDHDGIAHWDGTDWQGTRLTSRSSTELRGIWAASANQIWAVGTAGAILQHR